MNLPTNRIEALSDGVMAILITVMVFDLKFQVAPEPHLFNQALLELLPKFVSYSVSFLILAIMWVNHHQLFHQIRHTDRRLLWYNIHLLFWMSLVPFATHCIGQDPWLWQASSIYGVTFFLIAWSFAVLRNYLVRTDLLHERIPKGRHLRIRNKNYLAMALYLAGALLSFISVYLSFAFFAMVPAMYFVPEKIENYG